MPARRLALLLVPLLPALAGCGPDEGQVTLCARVVRALEGDAVRIVGREQAGGDRAAVVIRYRVGGAGAAEKRVVCRFAGAGMGAGRLRLTGVRRNDGSALSYLSLRQLRARLNLE